MKLLVFLIGAVLGGSLTLWGIMATRYDYHRGKMDAYEEVKRMTKEIQEAHDDD